MSTKRRKAGLAFTWQRTFSILAPWRRGKGDMVLDNEVVLTKMKLIQNFNESLLVAEDSFSTSSIVSVSERDVSEPSGTSEANSHLNEEESSHLDEEPRSPSEEPGSDYLSAIFSDSQLPRLYKFESEDSGVELPSGANSPSTPTGSEQSFVVHSRESSCDDCRLSASTSVPGTQVSSETGESEDKFPGSAAGTRDDPLLESTDELGSPVEREDAIMIEDPKEARCGGPGETLANDGSSEPEEEIGGMTERAFAEDSMDPVEACGDAAGEEFEPALARKSSTCDSLEEYMEECCRLSEVQQAGPQLPGSGLGYLEHICRLIEKIGQLQEANLRLQKQVCGLKKSSRAMKTKEDLFQQHCNCGAASLALQEPHKRHSRNDFLSLSGTLSDLSTIHEVTRRPALSVGKDRPRTPVPLWRRGQNRRSYTEGEASFLCDRRAEGLVVPQRRQSENYTWGRVKDLVRRTRQRNQSGLALTSSSLKMSCPQLYRPDLGPVELPSRNRNSMIALGHQNKLDVSWLQ